MSSKNDVEIGFQNLKESFPSPTNLNLNPYSRNSSNITVLREKKTSLSRLRDDELPEDINIVTISLKLEREKLSNHSNLREYPYNHNIKLFPEGFGEELKKEYFDCITTAAEYNDAKIICINELAIPLDEKNDVSKDVIDHLVEIASEMNCLIVAGSIYCTTSFLNKGYVFYPKDDNDNDDKGFYNFYKNFNTYGNDVNIFTPSERVIYYTKAFGIGICTLLSHELLDFPTSALLAQNSSYVDLVLCPTFIEDTKLFTNVVQSLSHVVSGVLVNNSYTKPNSSLFYTNGKENDSIISTTEKPDRFRIVSRTINISEYKKKKRISFNSMPSELLNLYGIENEGVVKRQ